MNDSNSNSISFLVYDTELREASRLIDDILSKIDNLPMCWDEFVGDEVKERVYRFQAKYAKNNRYWKEKVMHLDGLDICCICDEDDSFEFCESCQKTFCFECYQKHGRERVLVAK